MAEPMTCLSGVCEGRLATDLEIPWSTDAPASGLAHGIGVCMVVPLEAMSQISFWIFFVSALVHYPQARGSVMIRGSFSKARDSIESVKELLVEKVSFAKFQLRIKGPRVFLREQNTEFWTVTIIYMVMEKGL